MKRELPRVALEVHTEMLTPAQEKGLAERSLDIGLLRPPVRLDGIAQRVIAEEPLVLAAPEEHWLASAETVRIEQLRHEDFIMYGPGFSSVLNDTVVRSCLAAGFYPHCAHEVAETSTALALVAAGLGIAVLPDSVRAAPREGVVCKPIEDSLPVRLVLAWREDDDSPLLKRLLAILDENGMFAGPEDDPEDDREKDEDQQD